MRSQSAALLMVVMFVLIALPPGTQGQSVDSVTYLMGGIPQGKIVGGIVHNVTVELDSQAGNVTIAAYLSAGFAQGNFTNNYSWSYDNGVWRDNLYDYYLKNESDRYGSTYCFHIAIDSTARPGLWYWKVYIDGTLDNEEQLTVEAPVAGISMSAPTFYPRIFPYGEGLYDSWNSQEPNNSTNVWTKNIGNVPLKLTIDYDSLNSLFTTTNSTGTYLPGEERDHYLQFQAEKWSPRKFTVKGMINGEPMLVMTPNTISCIVAPQTTFDVVVTVARPGYDVYQMDGVTVQYKKFYSSDYDETLELDMYLTGNKSITLGTEMESLTLNFMEFFGEEYEETLTLDLQDDLEQFVKANVTCSTSPAQGQASILAYANFNIQPDDGSDPGSFTSTIAVRALPEGSGSGPILEPNMIVLIVIVAVFGVIGVFLYIARKKAQEERSRELEERIRKKKEQARRRR